MITVKVNGESIELTKVMRYRNPENVNEQAMQRKRDRSNRWYQELKKDPVKHREHLDRMASRRKTTKKKQ